MRAVGRQCCAAARQVGWFGNGQLILDCRRSGGRSWTTPWSGFYSEELLISLDRGVGAEAWAWAYWVWNNGFNIRRNIADSVRRRLERIE